MEGNKEGREGRRKGERERKEENNIHPMAFYFKKQLAAISQEGCSRTHLTNMHLALGSIPQSPPSLTEVERMDFQFCKGTE